MTIKVLTLDDETGLQRWLPVENVLAGQGPSVPPVVPEPSSGTYLGHVLQYRQTFDGKTPITDVDDLSPNSQPAEIIDSWSAWNVRALYDGNNDWAWKKRIMSVTHAYVVGGLAMRTAPWEPHADLLPDWAREHARCVAGMINFENYEPSWLDGEGLLRVELTITKQPKGHHLALWGLNDGGSWPPEIDLVETVNPSLPGISMNYHWKDDRGVKQDVFERFDDYRYIGQRVTLQLYRTASDLVWVWNGQEMKRAPHHGQLGRVHFLASWESNEWSGKPDGQNWGEVVFHDFQVWRKS